MRRALLQAIDRDALVSAVARRPRARARTRSSRRARRCIDAAVERAGRVRPRRGPEGTARRRLEGVGRQLDPEGRERPARHRAAEPRGGGQPGGLRGRGRRFGTPGTSSGSRSASCRCPPTELIGDRLARGDFQVAVLPLAIGLDPDLYPLMAASQTRSGGSNVAGLQDPELDKLLVAARTPVDASGADDGVRGAPEAARREHLHPPAGLPRRVRRVPGHRRRTPAAPDRGLLGSVLGRANMAPRRRQPGLKGSLRGSTPRWRNWQTR